MKRRLSAIFAALAMTMLLTAPAFANTVHQSNISSDNAGFQGDETECAGVVLQPGQVLWHFVHVGTDGSDLPSTLTATFTSAGTLTASGYSNGDGSAVVMYDIITPTADTFVTGSDTITTDPQTEPLNLSHICNGGPPPEVPEAPASVLLILTAGLGLGFLAWRRRSSQVTV
jgi:hypothetical protein